MENKHQINTKWKYFKQTSAERLFYYSVGGRRLPHWQSHQGGITFYLFRQSVLDHMHFRSHLDLEYFKVARTSTEAALCKSIRANPVAELLKGCEAQAKGTVRGGTLPSPLAAPLVVPALLSLPALYGHQAEGDWGARRLAVHERIFGSYSAHTDTHSTHPHMYIVHIYQHFIAFIWADNKIPISMKRNKNTYTRQTRTTMEHCGNNASNAKHRVTDKGRRTRLHCTPFPLRRPLPLHQLQINSRR